MQTEQDLEKLVHAHTAALLRYCTGLLGCEADAQDAVQKTFIKAWQQRRTLRGDGTKAPAPAHCGYAKAAGAAPAGPAMAKGGACPHSRTATAGTRRERVRTSRTALPAGG